MAVKDIGSSTIRDPRIRNSLLSAGKAKREAFLNENLNADDLIQGSSKQDVESQPQQIKDIRKLSEAISSLQTSYFSTFKALPVAPPGEHDNHSARFVSHATSENILESLEARRVRNISAEVQKTSLVQTSIQFLSASGRQRNTRRRTLLTPEYRPRNRGLSCTVSTK